MSVDESSAPFTTTRRTFAEPDLLLGLVDARAQISLNGTWRLIVDPMGVGEPGGFFGGFPRNKKVTTGMELVEYDFDTAQQVNVPGDWNTQDERLFFYQGRCWYFRYLDYTPTSDTRAHLYFDGANFSTDVYLNGKALMSHAGGYVPFSKDCLLYTSPSPRDS